MATNSEKLILMEYPRNHSFWGNVKEARNNLGMNENGYSSLKDFQKCNEFFSAETLKKISLFGTVIEGNNNITLISAKRTRNTYKEILNEAKKIALREKLGTDDVSLRLISECILFDKCLLKNKNTPKMVLHFNNDKNGNTLILEIFRDTRLHDFKNNWKEMKETIDYFQKFLPEGKFDTELQKNSLYVYIFKNTQKQNIINAWSKEVLPKLQQLEGFMIRNRSIKINRYKEIIEEEKNYVKDRNKDKTQTYRVENDDSHLLKKSTKDKRRKIKKYLD